MIRIVITAMLAFALPSIAADRKPTWGYDGYNGPENWAFMDPDWLVCDRGMQQSPVNLVSPIETEIPALEIFWNVTDWKIVNTGTTLRLMAEDPGYAIIHGREYQLLSFDFHTPSEHAINGQRYPMEAQFTHQDAEGRLHTISIMMRGGGRNDHFEAIMARSPIEVMMDSLVPELDPVGLVTDPGDILRYQGSATEPPCAEGMEWTILTDPVKVSDAAILAFTGLFPSNARPIQPLNRRYVLTD